MNRAGFVFRNALRFCIRNRALSVATSLCVAMGVAASALLFNVADTVFLRPLPFAKPDQLVGISSRLRASKDRIVAGTLRFQHQIR